ncbi:MAG: FAD-binding protein [Gammaproteobacteria bacterium]|nr:FAD-binding protein [Gammaproteobacteria bacterium]
MKYHKDKKWTNWGKTQTCRPALTFYPQSRADLVSIVNRARDNGKRVRVVGQGYSWSPLVPTDDYLVDVSNLNRVISIDSEKRLAVFETGVTVGQLDKALRKHNMAIPSNVLSTSFSYGGVVSTGSHGHGWDCQTVSDYVEALIVVLASGDIVRFSEVTHGKDVMNAVRISLGTLGIILEIWLRVEPIFNLEMVERKVGIDVVEDVSQLKTLVENSDYFSMFWVPLSSGLWLMEWNKTDKEAKRRPRSADISDFFGACMGNLQGKILRRWPTLTGKFMRLIFDKYVPKYKQEIRDVSDATHYRTAVTLIPSHNLSFAVKLDEEFENVKKVLFAVLDNVRAKEERKEFPLNLMVQVYFLKSSQALLSPSFGGDDEHYFYIELLSYRGTDGFDSFMKEISDELTSMPELQTRPHWAKRFLDVPGARLKIREAWGENLNQFSKIRDKLDPAKMFLNEYLEDLLAGDTVELRHADGLTTGKHKILDPNHRL